MRTLPINLGVGITRVGEEQLIAFDPVGGDGVLAFRRYKPIDELLTEFVLHARMFGRVHQYDGILVDMRLSFSTRICRSPLFLKFIHHVREGTPPRAGCRTLSDGMTSAGAANGSGRTRRSTILASSIPMRRVDETPVATSQSVIDIGTVWNAICRNGM